VRKGAKWTFWTALIAAGIALGLDIWLDIKEDAYTWSQWLAKEAKKNPLVPAIVGFVLGLLMGHFFWSQ